MAQPPTRPVPQVVMSATLDAAAFTRYFNGAQAAYIQVGGRSVVKECGVRHWFCKAQRPSSWSVCDARMAQYCTWQLSEPDEVC